MTRGPRRDLIVAMGCAIAATALLCSLSISSSSLWIDEATTAYVASQRHINHAWDILRDWKGSELQMPGYVAYVWTWEKIFGFSELSLRWAAAPFMVGYVFSILALPTSRINRFLVLSLSLLHPFIWYNLNEARPTIIVFFLAGMALAGILLAEKERTHYSIGLWFCAMALCVGMLMNMLFFFIFPVLSIVYLFSSRRDDKEWRGAIRFPTLIVTLFGIITLAYYFWTLKSGAGGMRERPSIANLLFAAYEFMGLSGLGPPRNVLRSRPLLDNVIPHLGLLLPALAVWLSLIVSWVYSVTRRGKRQIFLKDRLAVAFAAGVVIFVVISWGVQFRFWGRHMIVLLPAIIFYAAEMLTESAPRSRPGAIWATAVGVLFALCCIVSAATLRLSPEYAKDDYKGAVQSVLRMSSQDETVLWAGSSLAGMYYGLTFEGIKKPPKWPALRSAIAVSGDAKLDTLDSLTSAAAFKFVLFKKPDLFDSRGRLAEFLTERDASLQIDERDYRLFVIPKRTFKGSIEKTH